MMRFFILLIVWVFSLFYPTIIYADKIKGDFDRLPLMREEALKHRDDRAVDAIDYVLETPKGKFFEVDNDNLPIEVIVYKVDRTKQCKPLIERKDEDLIIYYFYKVNEFAASYHEIVDGVIWQGVKPEQAKASFQNLLPGYREFPAVYRALGVTSLASGYIDAALGSAERAVSANKYDPKAFWLLSICQYAAGKKRSSLKSYGKAMGMYPKVMLEFWEEDFISNTKPEIYHKWMNYTKTYK